MSPGILEGHSENLLSPGLTRLNVGLPVHLALLGESMPICIFLEVKVY